MGNRIGFIGTGIMGASIAKHLVKNNYEVHVFNRTKSKADELVRMGAIWEPSITSIVKKSDVIITMVGTPKQLEEIYFHEGGILLSASEGKIIIDMTTSTPTLAQKIYKSALEKGVSFLDAPVSGGSKGAKEGTLTIMVGGDKPAFEKVKSILENFSSKIILQGASGSGQHVKMANQIMVAGIMLGVIELHVYVKKANLNIDKVIEQVSLGSGRNQLLSIYSSKIKQNDYNPGFSIKHFIKDLKIALDEAEKMEIELPGTELAKKLYEKVATEGYENSGIQALIKLW